MRDLIPRAVGRDSQKREWSIPISKWLLIDPSANCINARAPACGGLP
jgi:hypothetical protein